MRIWWCIRRSTVPAGPGYYGSVGGCTTGSTVASTELAGVADLAERALPGHQLAVDLRDLIALDGALEASRRTVEDAIVAEERRLLGEPWRLLHDSPVGRNAARVGDLAVYGDIERRVAAGEQWTSKRMRTRSDYLWRMIARGAARATPRGWLAHVALVDVVRDGGWNGTEALHVCDSAASEEAENLDRRRTEQVSVEGLRSDDSLEIALAPLARLEPTHLVVWTFDGSATAMAAPSASARYDCGVRPYSTRSSRSWPAGRGRCAGCWTRSPVTIPPAAVR